MNPQDQPVPLVEAVEPRSARGAVEVVQQSHNAQDDPAGAHSSILIHTQGPSLLRRLRRERGVPSKRLARLMLAVLFLVMFLAGWNDASQGPLLPSLQDYYHVNYLVISTIWMASFAGSLVAGLLFVPITDRFGFGVATPIAAFIAAVAYALIAWGGPFPLFVCCYVLIGFGVGTQDAQVNAITGRLPNSQTKMFVLHAMYGLGATVSPFVATAFVQRVTDRVYLYFTVSVGLALVTCALLVGIFRGRFTEQIAGSGDIDEKDTKKLDRDGASRIEEGTTDPGLGRAPPESPSSGAISRSRKALGDEQIARPGGSSMTAGSESPCEKKDEGQGSGHKMKRIIRAPVVHLLAIYFLLYVGVEVGIGGWATSFLEAERGGTNNAGYVSSGYFGGLTVGRIILIPVTGRLGNHTSMFVYTAFVVLLSIIIWVTHTIVGNAVCFSLIGIFLGPMYPIVINVIVEIMPIELQGGTIGWCGSVGQAGSAMMPFIIGAVSDKYGVWVLQPFVIALMSASMLIWLAVVYSAKRHVGMGTDGDGVTGAEAEDETTSRPREKAECSGPRCTERQSRGP